jgi:hypothetical protein
MRRGNSRQIKETGMSNFKAGLTCLAAAAARLLSTPR